MGIDIYGCIEIQAIDDTWIGVAKIHPALMNYERNKAMMGFLFSPYTDYQDAIAANRGLPQNASKESIAENEGFQHTWISWNEIQGIVWEESEFLENLSALTRIQKLLSQADGSSFLN